MGRTQLENSKFTDKMWDIVSTLGWDTDHNVSRCKMVFLKKYTIRDAKAFRLFMREMFAKLDAAVKAAEGRDHRDRVVVTGGDDTYGDKLYETIGRGRRHFQACIEDPSLIESTPYRECFSYAIPYTVEDYQKLKPGFHKRAAEKWRKKIIDLTGKARYAHFFRGCNKIVETVRANDKVTLTYDEIRTEVRQALAELENKTPYAEGKIIMPQLQRGMDNYLANICHDYHEYEADKQG